MKRTYSLSQRLIAHVLLWSFLLQSCYNYNAPAPLPHIPNTERQEISKKLPRPMSGNIHSQEETLPFGQPLEVLPIPNTHLDCHGPSGRAVTEAGQSVDKLIESRKSTDLDRAPTKSSQTSDQIPSIGSNRLNRPLIPSDHPSNHRLQTHENPFIAKDSHSPEDRHGKGTKYPWQSSDESDRSHSLPLPGTKIRGSGLILAKGYKGEGDNPLAYRKLTLLNKGATTTSVPTKCPNLGKQIQLPPTRIEKQLPTPLTLPTTLEELTQVNSPENVQETASYPVKGGYQVKFMQHEQGWMALVQEVFPGFHRSFPLPVFFIGMSMSELVQHQEPKRYIQVILPTKGQAGGVVVGQQGLLGGGQLHDAIYKGDIEKVKELITSGVDLNAKNDSGDTPLNVAIYRNNKDIVGLLIRAGAKVNGIDHDEYIPLHDAIYRDNQAIVALLIAAKANLDIKDKHGNTPLHRALAYDKKDLVEMLVRAGANLETRDTSGYTPLRQAIYRGNKDLVEILLSAEANVDGIDNEYIPLHDAISSKKQDIVELLIQYKANLELKDKSGYTPLRQAIYRGNKDLVEILLSAGANVDGIADDEYIPLHDVVYDDKQDIVVLLIAAKANLEIKDKNGYTPLRRAIDNNNKDIVELLIRAGAKVNSTTEDDYTRLHDTLPNNIKDILGKLTKALEIKDKKGYTPLRYAISKSIFKNNTDIVELLINGGAKVDPTDEDDYSPLHETILYNKKDIIALLVKAGANLEIKDKHGYTPLHRAISNNDKDLVELLVKAGANLEIKDKHGYTPLYRAISDSNRDLVELLLKAGAKVNPIDENDYIPLHEATRGENQEIVELLVKLGANVNAKDNEGDTPLHCAIGRGQKEVVQLLLDVGASLYIENNQGEFPIQKVTDGGGLQACVEIFAMLLPLSLDLSKEAIYTTVNLLFLQALCQGNEKLTNCLVNLGADKNVKIQQIAPEHPVIWIDKPGNVTKIFIPEDLENNQLEYYLSLVDDFPNPILHFLLRRGVQNGIDIGSAIQLLIKLNINLETVDKDENTPLHVAIETDNLEITKILVGSGANLEAKDKEGNTPLHRVVAKGNIELIQVLLLAGANIHAPNQEGLSPLEAVYKAGKTAIVQAMLQAIDVNARDQEGFSHLYKALQHELPGLAQQLIGTGTDINGTHEEGWTDLHIAAKHGHVEVVKQLLELKANPCVKDKNGNIPLHIALQYKQQEVVELLIQQAFDPATTQEQTDAFLQEAFKEQHVNLVTQVIQAGSYVDGRDEKWMTHFHRAIEQGNVQVARRLKELGADIHAKNKKGENALHLAMRLGHIELAKWLMECGVSYQVPDYSGHTPFYTALKYHQLGLVEQLMKKGMDINARDQAGRTALHQAIQEGDINRVQQLIALGVNMHVEDSQGLTPLQMALQGDHQEIVRLLVQASFSSKKKEQTVPAEKLDKRIQKHVEAVLQLKTDSPTTAPSPAAIASFHEAVRKNDLSLVKQLVEAGLPISCINQNGENALHIAVQGQHADLAVWLLQQGINASVRDQSGKSPLYHALKQGNMELAKKLVKAGLHLEDDTYLTPGFTTLHEAVKQGDINVVSHLLALGAPVISNPGKPKTMPLHVAAQYGHVKIAQMLSQAGSDWHQQDIKGLTPLQVAAQAGQYEFIQQVLQQVMISLHQPNQEGMTHLHQAILQGDVKLVKILLQAGAEVPKKNQEGKTALHLASQQGNVELMEAFLKQGANIHEPDHQGWTPLHAAVYNGHLTVAKRLVELGSELHAKTQDDCHLLHLAAAQGHEQVVDWLLEQGLDIHASNLAGQTSLHIAAAKGHLGIVKTLLYQGASVHLQDQQGNTPLHLSAQHGHTQVSTTLVQEGASVTVLDHRKRSPLFVAIQQGHFDLVYQSSSVYTSQQHTQHTTHPIVLQEALASQPTRSVASLQIFLEEYSATLLPEQVEPFTKLITPLLIERLSTQDVHGQEKIICYLQEGGQLYPGVLKNCPVSNWIQESLLLDIGREALVQGNEFLFQQLQEQLQVLSKHAKPGDIEKLLLILQQKRLIEPFQLDTLLEVLQFASVMPMPLALKMLAITNFNWQLSWKSAWLYKQLPYVDLGESRRNILQHSLLHLPWSPAITLRFLEGLQGEQALATVDDFLCFVSKYEVPESLLMMALHQPPSYATLNQLQAWKHYIACELLKNKLVSVFPGHVKPLYDKLAFLLGHGCAYESIDALLTHLQASSQSSSTHGLAPQQAQHLLEALNLLVEYRPSLDVCERVWKLLKAEKDLSSQNQSIDRTIHRLIVDTIFLKEHERSIEEINDYIATQAPGVHFIGDVKALDKAYQDVEDAYHRGSQPIKGWDRRQITQWAKNFQKQIAQGNTQPVKQAEIVAVIKRAVYLQYKYQPRDTQIMALLSFLNPAENQGRLLQINTGEGKSLIVAMLAAIHALRGKKVDVVTSSTELSIPEVAKQQDFFAMFGLAVGENSNYDSKKEVYQRDIVYGTAGDFQGDILRTEFSGDDLRGDRGFGVVIVDEVDNLLFDNRNSSIQLSSPTPGMHHLEPVLAAVWSYVSILACHLLEKNGKTYFITEKFQVEGGQIKLFSDNPLAACMFEVKDREAFLQEKTVAHLRQLLRDLSSEERREREALQSIQERIALLGQEITTLQQETCEQVKEAAKEQKNKKKLEKIARKEREKREKEQLCNQLLKEIEQIAWKKNQRDEIIEIPIHLQDFARHQIPYWTQNAIAALWHQKEVHYDVQDGKIVPIDYANTGVLQTNMVWAEGLAQMLQIKEGLRLESENLSNNFISTVGYFKRYSSCMYGMTGTLGNQPTHRFFKELYGVDMATIPPYKLRPIYGNGGSSYVCKELPPIIVPTQQEWVEAIVRTTLQQVKHGRAALVLCQYIDQVKQLEKLLRAQYHIDNIFTYTGQTSFHKHDIKEGEIILATNISGRGTDIKTSDTVERNGGMHVCMTFLPTNYRVELQNAGRTAREGKKGTAQLVLYETKKGHSIEYLRARRDVQEAKGIKAAMDEVAEMRFKDQLFTKFCALENELFLSASEQTKIEQNQLLQRNWTKNAKFNLSPERVDALYQKRIEDNIAHNLKTNLEDNSHLSFSQSDIQELTEKIRVGLKKLLPKEAFKKQYEQKFFDDFCQAMKAYVSADVLASFQEGKSYTPNHVSYGTTQDWGRYEREALEERWGFWLHQVEHERHHFTQKEILQKFDEFASQIRSDAYAGRLVQNPYFYLLKGNDCLRRKDYGLAIEAYDQAIALDPFFSFNARYNKVRAMFRQKKNKSYHGTAQKELERALVLIANTHKPTLLSIHGMTGIGDPKPNLAEYLQHQLNILSAQENHIMTSLGAVKKALRKDWEINKIKKRDLKDLTEVFQDEPVSHQKAINKAKTNGLTQLFTITEKKPTPWWSICAVALIGLVQITAGVLITALTAGVGSQLGTKLLSDGISDLVTAAKAAWSGKFSWAEWGLEKAISWTVSLLTIGFSKVCETFKKVAQNVGLLDKGLGQKGIGLAMKQVSLELGKTVAKECINGLVDYGLSKFALDDIEKAITQRVSEQIAKALEKSSFVRQALELDNQQGNNYWQQLLIKDGMERLIKEENKWETFFWGVWKGGLNSTIKGATAFFQLAEASTAIYNLCTYTENFIEEWGKGLASQYQDQLQQQLKEHRNLEIILQQQEKIQQKDTLQTTVHTLTARSSEEKGGIQVARLEDLKDGFISEHEKPQDLDKTYTSPSNPKAINRAFTKVIGSKLSGDMRNKLVKPVTNAYVNITVDRVTRDVSNSLKKSMEAHNQEVHVYDLNNQVPTALEEVKDSEVKKYGPQETDEVKVVIDQVVEEDLQAIEKGREGETSMLGVISKENNSPVVVYSKNGKVYMIIGEKLPGEPVHMRHVENENGGGHWVDPRDPTGTPSSGPTNCMLDVAYKQMGPEAKAKLDKLDIKDGSGLRKHVVQQMRKQPALTREILKTTTALRWRNAEALMTGGSVLSKTADGMLAAQKWLDDHPSIKALLNNTSRIVGTAMWLKNFTPLGLLTGVVMEVGYTKVMKWVEEKTNAQENLSAYLLSIDGDLNKEQADALSSAAIQFMEGVGRVAMHGFSSKQLKKWEKGTKKLESKDNKRLKENKKSTKGEITLEKQNKSFVFKTTVEEGNLKFIEVKLKDGVIEFGGDFIKKDGVLIIKNFDVDGQMTNKLGVKGIKAIMKEFGKQEGVTKIIVEGAPRTTGANPGKITNLTFNIEDKQ